MEKVLPFHPDYAQKIGCGVNHIKVNRSFAASIGSIFLVFSLVLKLKWPIFSEA